MTDLEQAYLPFRGSHGLQTPQTLDQSYYDMLRPEELMTRDRDQVVYKWFKPSTTATTATTLVPDLDTLPGSIHLMAHLDEATDTQLPRTVVRSPSLSANSMVEKQPQTDTEHDKLVPEAAGNGRLPGPASKEDIGSTASFGLGRRDTLSNLQLKKLILIHQLWLWKIDENTVITSFPERWHTGVEDTLLETIRQSGVSEFRNPEDLIVHILYECVSFLEKYRDAGLGNHILDIFESSIATRANQEVSYFKKFNASIQGARDREEGQTKSEQHRPKDDIDGEVNLIYEVKDIRDELHLIQRVFKSQAAVIDKFSKLFWPGIGEEDKQYREKFIEDCGVGDIIERAEKLDEDANRTLEGLDYLVQVKQAQSSLKESVAAGELNIKALEEAKRSQKLNNYIMLFTTISVVFVSDSLSRALLVSAVC
ncbi:hypothetical protein GQ53DRAFT_130451 [Thozetella sp. PMI_491]|nr:hypothetical protein GQ53DRAFT_130451 [Thozetella sp. PMI_491]